jgi:amino acid transporter
LTHYRGFSLQSNQPAFIVQEVEKTRPTELVRALGRWTLTALVVNSIIGGGIFGLPSVVAALLGGYSLLAYLLAALGLGVILACFAEVASRFRHAGGAYLYARVAFGPFAGIQIAWMYYLARVTGVAANSNLFVIYLANFFPAVTQPLPRLIILTLLWGGLTLVNYRGVSAGASLSNFFAVVKILPLILFAGVGIFFVHIGYLGVIPRIPTGTWFDAVLIAVFAFKGFEAAVVPMSEAKDPERDSPFALFTGLAICASLYMLVQFVVVGVLRNPGETERPLADAAWVFMGRPGATLLACGALFSIYGLLSSMILSTPRVTFALAERGDFPRLLAAIHPRFRTPHVSIVAFGLLTWILSVAGTFRWNVTLSVVATLLVYTSTCAAVPVLRTKNLGEPFFKLPAGWFFAVLGIVFCIPLVFRLDPIGAWIVAATILAASLNWLWARRT